MPAGAWWFCGEGRLISHRNSRSKQEQENMLCSWEYDRFSRGQYNDLGCPYNTGNRRDDEKIDDLRVSNSENWCKNEEDKEEENVQEH